MSDLRDIFVRAHTVTSTKPKGTRNQGPKWPKRVLVFDTECTLDTAQKLTIGAYRVCELTKAGYRCVDEGIFGADDLSSEHRKIIESYIADPRHVPQIEFRTFPPRLQLSAYTRSEFVERVFWKAIRKGAMVVGFNLPFDLSRLAVRCGVAQNSEWSLALSLRKSHKTGDLEPYPERPRIVIDAKNTHSAFIRFSSILHHEEWPRSARFLDLRTLGWALRNEIHKLEKWCSECGIKGKLDHKLTGSVTTEEIDYCREDVRATTDLLNFLKKEFDQHPIAVQPDQAYSPASIAKSYLKSMGLVPPRNKFDVSNQDLGITMQGYYGGRAECRIRKVPVPIVLVDYTSQYPSVNALLANWDVLTALSVRFEDCTKGVSRMLRDLTLEDTLNPAFWKRLSFFALIEPEDDILPVRTLFNGRTTNIGLNYLTSNKSIWYAGPDVVGDVLLARKVPKIVRAIRLVSHGRQDGLTSTNLAGLVAVDPNTDDLFRHVVEQRSVHKRTNKSLGQFLKVVANSGSYGTYVEVNPERPKKPAQVQVFSDPVCKQDTYPVIEKPGEWYFPSVASLITAGGRLLLAIAERLVTDAGGSYLFCDTDSLCIVGTQNGGLVACPGGGHTLPGGTEAIKALSWQQIREITERLNQLNPYNPSLVPDLLKIEDINYKDSDPVKPQRQLHGYAISAKRYVLYEEKRRDIHIVKASGHGLGFLCPPKDRSEDSDELDWIVEAWDWLLRKELGLPTKEPLWLDLPAMMRMTLNSPLVMRNRRPDWLSPFGFFLVPLISELGGYPAGYNRSNFKYIVPYTSDRSKWKTLTGINLCHGLEHHMEMTQNAKQDTVVPESFRTILRLYCSHPESKSLAPDMNPCAADTRGLLKRASIEASRIIPVGKETDRRWEQGDDRSMLDFRVLEYQPVERMVIADQQILDEIAKRGMRETIRRSGLSQHTIEAIRDRKRVRCATLQCLIAALANG